MGTSRVIAVTLDQAIGKTLRGALTAAGADVSVAPSPAALGPGSLDCQALFFHFASDLHVTRDGTRDPSVAAMAELAGRLPAGGKVIAVLPTGHLAGSVAIMRAHPRVAGVVALDRMRGADLAATAARLLVGGLFGVDKVLPWGARVHSLRVGDYQGKADAVQAISEFASAVGLRRLHRERIERCSDEMMMNALYDAPVGADGRPLGKDGAARGSDGLSLAPEDHAIVQYGCDGARFAVSVRDRFGRLDRDTLLRYLHKCLYAEQQIDHKPGGGAGLGLYFMARSSSSLLFNVLPGGATECVCLFDLEAPRPELDQLGVFEERADAAGALARPAATPKASPPGPPAATASGDRAAPASAASDSRGGRAEPRRPTQPPRREGTRPGAVPRHKTKGRRR